MPTHTPAAAGFTLAMALAFASPGGSGLAIADTHCQETIVTRGSDLFSAEQKLTARCVNDLGAGNCPDSAGSERISAALQRAEAAVSSACNIAGGNLTCFAVAADEAIDMVLAPIGSAPPTPTRASRQCQRVITRKVGRLAALRLRALESCNRKAAGGIGGYGPPGPSCDGPGGQTQAAIATAGAQARSAVAAACNGLDPQDDLFFGTTCPGAPHCVFAIPTTDDLVACVACIAEEEVDQLSTGLAQLPLSPGESCAVARGRAGRSLADALMRDRATCNDDWLRGHRTTCPDGETLTDVGTDIDQYVSTVSSACGFDDSFAAVAIDDQVASLVATAYPAPLPEADQDKQVCKRQIGDTVGATGTGGFARRTLRFLTSCKVDSHCGQVVGVCPSASTTTLIATAAAGNAAAIHHDCDAFTPADVGFPTPCVCSGLPVATIDDLVACLQCASSQVDFFVSGFTFPP